MQNPVYLQALWSNVYTLGLGHNFNKIIDAQTKNEIMKNYKCGITPENIQELKDNEMFVFGSNLAGIHGAGAALLAKEKFGAKQGIGHGLTGHCYAFPTKDRNIQPLPIASSDSFSIKDSVDTLLECIKVAKEKHFLITEVGCGLAGFTPEQIAPFFKEFLELENCSLPQRFLNILYKPKIIRTYKMTDENMKCQDFQFELNKKYTISEPLKICKVGFHSCQIPQNCLNFYNNNGKNRLFLCEIEINGNEQFENPNENLESFLKICSDNITFIEELTDKMSILFNSGNWNSGNRNSGNYNSGDLNSGDWNSGNYNSGNYNSGGLNSGNGNSGNYNSGDLNSGDWNSGNRNSGNWNSGNRNSGNWNSGNWNSGDLNTTDAPWRCFNQFQTTKKSDYYFPSWLYFDLIVWKYESEMSDLEKEQYPYYKTCGGCLIVKDYKEAAQESYNKATKSEQDAIEKLPSYDPQVLFDLFGIDRRNKS